MSCTAQHSTAQHSTAQHSTAQHRTAPHSTWLQRGRQGDATADDRPVEKGIEQGGQAAQRLRRAPCSCGHAGRGCAWSVQRVAPRPARAQARVPMPGPAPRVLTRREQDHARCSAPRRPAALPEIAAKPTEQHVVPQNTANRQQSMQRNTGVPPNSARAAKRDSRQADQHRRLLQRRRRRQGQQGAPQPSRQEPSPSSPSRPDAASPPSSRLHHSTAAPHPNRVSATSTRSLTQSKEKMCDVMHALPATR